MGQFSCQVENSKAYGAQLIAVYWLEVASICLLEHLGWA